MLYIIVLLSVAWIVFLTVMCIKLAIERKNDKRWIAKKTAEAKRIRKENESNG